MTDKKERAPADPKCWPAWRYGPKGEAAVFAHPDDVPAGWVDSRKKARAAEAAKPATKLADKAAR